MIQLVRDKSAERGLLLNVKKTKILVVDSNRENTSVFKINGEEIKEVDDFIYLGSTITNKGNSHQKSEAASYGEGGSKQNGQHLEESKGQFESQAEGAMGHCLPQSYMEASHGLCKRQMNGECTPSRCCVTEGS